MSRRSGLKRFLELVPDMPVAEAQAEAMMSDEELDELVNIATAILDDGQRQDSVYDMSVLRGQQRMEQRLVGAMEGMASEMRKLKEGFVGLCQAMNVMADRVYEREAEPTKEAPSLRAGLHLVGSPNRNCPDGM